VFAATGTLTCCTVLIPLTWSKVSTFL
jgi:hypothetical protein